METAAMWIVMALYCGPAYFAYIFTGKVVREEYRQFKVPIQVAVAIVTLFATYHVIQGFFVDTRG
jgi:predicted membrane channel-forming protein YqfA (hemolysin III family)